MRAAGPLAAGFQAAFAFCRSGVRFAFPEQGREDGNGFEAPEQPHGGHRWEDDQGGDQQRSYQIHGQHNDDRPDQTKQLTVHGNRLADRAVLSGAVVTCFMKDEVGRSKPFRDSGDQKLPPRFSRVSMTTVQSGDTCCITKYICSMGMATQPPV